MTSKVRNSINVADVRERAIKTPFCIDKNGKISLTGDQSLVARQARSEAELNRTLWKTRREQVPKPPAELLLLEDEEEDEDEGVESSDSDTGELEDVHPASL